MLIRIDFSSLFFSRTIGISFSSFITSSFSKIISFSITEKSTVELSKEE
jgi:hypothetical protein